MVLGNKVLEQIMSPINGKIRVVKSFGLGTYIQVHGLTQSGGVVYEMWRSTLRKIRKSKPEIRNCLILGLGGGSAATLVKKYWPKSQVLGVDIDPFIVELGRKHLGLTGIKVAIADAKKTLEGLVSAKKKYDLILVDTYVGYTYPKKFEEQAFLKLVKKALQTSGIAVFNRLYMAQKRSMAVKFGRNLEKVFAKVDYFYPEANLMLLCYN